MRKVPENLRFTFELVLRNRIQEGGKVLTFTGRHYSDIFVKVGRRIQFPGKLLLLWMCGVFYTNLILLCQSSKYRLLSSSQVLGRNTTNWWLRHPSIFPDSFVSWGWNNEKKYFYTYAGPVWIYSVNVLKYRLRGPFDSESTRLKDDAMRYVYSTVQNSQWEWKYLQDESTKIVKSFTA